MRWLPLLFLPAALALYALALAQDPRPRKREVPRRLFTPASAVEPALRYVRGLPPDSRPFTRFLSAYNAHPDDLRGWQLDATFALNSLSRNGVAVPPALVPGSGGRLLAFSLEDYRIPRRAWRRLADLGSGRDPYPDPFFHLEVDEEKDVYEDSDLGHWEDGQGARVEEGAPGAAWVKTGVRRRKVGSRHVRTLQAQPPWLPRRDTLALVAETECESPVLRLDWFCYYALLEPRYHEFLGLGDGKRDYERLAGVEEVADDDETRELGSIVLDSEVATNNRALFRRASPKRHGRAYFWESRDFDKSLGAADILQDPSRVAGAPLDRAGIQFAHDGRNGFRSVEVEVRNCFCCHAEGMIAVADDVRGYSAGDVALGLRRLKKRDRRKAAFIADRYFGEGVDNLVTADQQNYGAAVRACVGRAGAAQGLALRRLLLGFEANRRLEDLALETGYPVVTVLGVLERSHPTPFDPRPIGFGLGHEVMGVLTGRRRVRYDQFSSGGFGHLMTRLAALPVDAPPRARGRDVRSAKGKGRHKGRLARRGEE
jgi:hypothetical protein